MQQQRFRALPILAGLLVSMAFSALTAQAADSRFYVSPKGRDNWSGTLADPDKSGIDGPFASIPRALDAAKALRVKQGGRFTSPCIIYLRDGIYTLDSALNIGPGLSGTPNCPLVLSRYLDETPILSGGKTLTGWKAVTVNGFNVWETYIPEVQQGRWTFHQLWVNGSRRHRARTPDTGSFRIDAVYANDAPRIRIGTHPGDLPSGFDFKNGEAAVFASWVDIHVPIKGMQGGDLVFAKPMPYEPAAEAGDRYYVENCLSALDRPGEWYQDETTGRILYYPMPGETLANTGIVAPRLNPLLLFSGEPAKNIFVENVQIIGLTFSYNEWYFPKTTQVAPTSARCADDWIDQLCPDKDAFGQSSVGVPAAVKADGLLHGLFQANRFSHLGTYALQLYQGCRGNTILANTFEDLGAGAIKMGQQLPGSRFTGLSDAENTADNLIQDNIIRDGGNVFQSAMGIWIGQSHNNRILHNEIADFFNSGISIGWAWGYDPTNTHDNQVEWNHIHHLGRKSSGEGPYLSDMGGIYTLGIQPGTLLASNLVHDISAARYGGWGIYFDQATSNVTVNRNIVYNTYEGGFFQHWGRDNRIENNIFAFDAKTSVKCFWHGPEHRFDFRKNIIISGATAWDPVSGKVGDVRPWGADLTTIGFSSDSNLYWQTTSGTMGFERYAKPYALFRGLKTWQDSTGLDAHSLVADPMFNDPAHYDFTLRSGSRALSLGFQPFNLFGVGVGAPPANPWNPARLVERSPGSRNPGRLFFQYGAVDLRLEKQVREIRVEIIRVSGKRRIVTPMLLGSGLWRIPLAAPYRGQGMLRVHADGLDTDYPL